MKAWISQNNPVTLRTEMVDGVPAWCLYTNETKPRVVLMHTTAVRFYKQPKTAQKIIQSAGGLAYTYTQTKPVAQYHAAYLHMRSVLDAKMKSEKKKLSDLAREHNFDYDHLYRTYAQNAPYYDARPILAVYCGMKQSEFWPQIPDTVIGGRGASIMRLLKVG